MSASVNICSLSAGTSVESSTQKNHCVGNKSLSIDHHLIKNSSFIYELKPNKMINKIIRNVKNSPVKASWNVTLENAYSSTKQN